jgi:hypothetical protein
MTQVFITAMAFFLRRMANLALARFARLRQPHVP